jgi:hypothetical protein
MYISQCGDYATGWTTGVQFPAVTMVGFLSLPHRSSILLSNKYRGLYPRGKVAVV